MRTAVGPPKLLLPSCCLTVPINSNMAETIANSNLPDTTAAPSGKRRNLAIQQYLKTHTPTGTLPDWTQCPEVPTLENLFETVDEEVVNLIDQPWPSKLEYLKNQYLLLREDALRPLRHVVKVVQDSPHMPEDSLLSNLGIYDHVCAW